MKNKIKAGILGVLLLVLLLPMLNQVSGIVKSGPLNGDVQLATDTAFTWQGWWDGSYQKQKEAYLNDQTGFRPDLVRLNNQIDYSIFRKLHAREVVIGKDQYLYEQGYISAYYGREFAGYNHHAENLYKLLLVRDTLLKAGKKLFIVFAPSKARIYPEFIPDYLRSTLPHSSNYETMVRICDSLKLPYLDFNSCFRAIKEKTSYPLFGRKGTHWTHTGSDIAADTFNHYLAAVTGKPVPEISWDDKETERTNTARGFDDDIDKGINLIWPLREDTFYYHKLHFEAGNPQERPRVIFISDSFFWSWLNSQVPQHCYKDWEFWYYFNELWTERSINGEEQSGHEADNRWMERLQKTDVVVLMYGELNLADIGSSFIDKAYKAFYEKGRH